MEGKPRSQNYRRVVRAALIAGQWFVLSVFLGAALVRTERTFEGLISPRYDSSTVFIAAFIAALLLGLTIESPRILFPAVFLMCLAAAGLFILVTYVPAWEGTILRTRALDNFAINRSLVLLLLMTFPAAIGAVSGYFLGGLFDARHEVLGSETEPDTDPSWWAGKLDG